jgi:hypothetical protein
MYLLGAFLQSVIEYKVITQVNFSLNSSPFLLALNGGDTTTYASINLASGSEYSVQLPITYNVSQSDVGRILALRSSLYPTYNSGLFRITSASILQNIVTVDYRSTEYPPFEVETLKWAVYENEAVIAHLWNTSSNGARGYNTNYASQASRVLLSSPSGWTLRLSLESATDVSGSVPSGFSIAPGVGQVDVDFSNSEGFLHGAMWFNTTSSFYRGMTVGLPTAGKAVGQWRFTAIGDDLLGTCLAFTRNVSFMTGGTGWTAFGIPEDESAPPPSDLLTRVFVFGNGNALSQLTWKSGFYSDGIMQGVAWGYGSPVPCVLSSYSDAKNLDPQSRNFSWAADSAFGGFTELIDVEIVVGTMTSSYANSQPSVVPFCPHRLGRFPLARQGRSNYTQWSVSPDKNWLHTQDGIFIPWAGPLLVDNVTGSSNVYSLLIENQNASDDPSMQDGVLLLEPNPPMSDPFQPTQSIPQSTVTDASRYKKTYSFFRTPPNLASVSRGGSNPTKL